MQTFVAVYLAVGFLIGFGLFGWLFIASVRRHGLRRTAGGAVRTYVHELPLYWRVPWASWTVLISLPLIVVWAIAKGDLDVLGLISLALLWLLYFALLRWHHRAKAAARSGCRGRDSNPYAPRGDT